MTGLLLPPRHFAYEPSENSIFQNVKGRNWLLLMQFQADDRLGVTDKHNTAIMVDRNFQSNHKGSRERISFDTTVNAFPVDFYANAAGLTDVSFIARLDAIEWRVQIFCRIGFEQPMLIAETSGEGPAEVSLPLPLQKARNARISVTITYRGNLSCGLLAFATPAPARFDPIGVSITTYNKPLYLLRNLEVIQSSTTFKAGLIDLLVVNNGDPIDGLPTEIEEIRLANVGGTGGFNAATKYFQKKGYGHFVIMDDDIILHPDVVNRFYALSCFSRGQHVGSLAEIENTPGRIVKEQGANVSREHTFGIEMINPLIDISGWYRDQLYKFRTVDYSGWWALMIDLKAIPHDIVPKYFFIKRDDVTFGYESRRNGAPTVVFPNLLIAHSEEGSASYMYYDVRNDLIMRARNSDQLSISLKGLAAEMATKFFTYRLDEQRMFNRALSDFLNGPQWLEKRAVGQTLREVRRLTREQIAVPGGNPVIQSDNHVPRRRMLLAWLRPSAWRVQYPLPLVPAGHRACVTEIGGYIALRPYSLTGTFYRRSLANIVALAHGGILLARFALVRRKVIASYKVSKK